MSEAPKRRRLDAEQVGAEAERIVDAHGWDRLTIAALAAGLGMKGPSLYNHVSSLDSLRGELQQRTMRQLGSELVSAALGRAGPEGFFALAHAYRAFVRRHPNRYDGMTRAPIDREGLFRASSQANEAVLAVVRSYGVAPPNALLAELGVFAALHGAVTLEASGFFGGAVDHDVLYDSVVAGAERQLATLAGEQAA